jgi:hypothetical protein
MIGSLLYLTVIWLDIELTMCLCACFQAFPHPFSSLDLIGFSDADFVGCEIDRKNTFSTCHFNRSSLICWSAHKQSSVI